ncbi:hypothetical protein Tgr7_0550 [Thioalkalivibrio sulfidiphilus HL-EbGr7]|uniref:Lipoprotein n=1 Tax=Thioalkalivibrio sulfidiphilus (strain HL-EbGR7) TaxID=396588 RepID=B8GLP4_THISH|nr:hypothetical protein [Thioalkalivibrio sulfidiphilus]ACL71647.1 hypothetical protein Tgr7_0550 [Thioalkalivibrio sulfidiphilus HL-EbGr7]
MRSLFRVSITAALVLGAAGCQEVEVSVPENTGQALCFADYQTCVDPIFHGQISGVSCSASSCHDVGAGSGGGFKIFPNLAPGDERMLANYFAARSFANLTDPDNSKLLLEPLQGSFGITGTHGGGNIFPDRNDACYIAIRNWISLRVDDSNSEACGVCTPVDISSCGF